MGRCRGVQRGHVALPELVQRLAGEFRQLRLPMHAQNAFHQRTGDAVVLLGDPIAQSGRQPRQLAVTVSLSHLLFDRGDFALGVLHRPVAQHQVREIQIELVRRHIGAFGQETHVAEGAGVDDRREIGALDRVEFAAFAVIDQIEQAGEAVAEIEAAAAAMANVEHAAQLVVELGLVMKAGVLPRNRVPCRRPEAAFRHGSLRDARI